MYNYFTLPLPSAPAYFPFRKTGAAGEKSNCYGSPAQENVVTDILDGYAILQTTFFFSRFE